MCYFFRVLYHLISLGYFLTKMFAFGCKLGKVYFWLQSWWSNFSFDLHYLLWVNPILLVLVNTKEKSIYFLENWQAKTNLYCKFLCQNGLWWYGIMENVTLMANGGINVYLWSKRDNMNLPWNSWEQPPLILLPCENIYLYDYVLLCGIINSCFDFYFFIDQNSLSHSLLIMVSYAVNYWTSILNSLLYTYLLLL